MLRKINKIIPLDIDKKIMGKYRVFHKSCNQKYKNLAKKKKKKEKHNETVKHAEWQH